MLSGGLDSSGITALAARELKGQGQTLNTFSIDFKDHEKNFKPNIMHLSIDTSWAMKMAQHSSTNQHTIVLDNADLLEKLLMPTRAHDRPGMGQMETYTFGTNYPNRRMA